MPVGITGKTSDADRTMLTNKANEIAAELVSKLDVRAETDLRGKRMLYIKRVKIMILDNQTVGWKFNHWEQKGVPIRLVYCFYSSFSLNFYGIYFRKLGQKIWPKTKC